MENKQVIQHANKHANEKQKQEDLAKMAELKVSIIMFSSPFRKGFKHERALRQIERNPD
jgi:hypothetical protein